MDGVKACVCERAVQPRVVWLWRGARAAPWPPFSMHRAAWPTHTHTHAPILPTLPQLTPSTDMATQPTPTNDPTSEWVVDTGSP